MGEPKKWIAGKVVATTLDSVTSAESWRQNQGNLVSGKALKETKVALLIGVSEYEYGYQRIPAAVKDVQAMQCVLNASGLGDFDQVDPLENPDSSSMKRAIENLFMGRNENDLVLLFFSGHGFKDINNKLYLGTRNIRKNEQADLFESSAVSASFIYNLMNRCHSKKQVVILDCCFSGAFPEGLIAKDDTSIDVKSQLGGKGRVILSSSSSTQLSFSEEKLELSPYTRYLVEGIYMGKASIDELHKHVKQKIQNRFPALQPEIYAEEEGLNIIISKAKKTSNNNEFIKGILIGNKTFEFQKILPEKIFRRLILGLAIIVFLLLGSAFLLKRRRCQVLHERWFASGPENAWVRAKYTTANAKHYPEMQFCEAIGIPINRFIK